MRADETIKYLDDKDFLDKLYGYAYKRCSTSHEAEDLCSDIILSILKSIQHNPEVNNFYAFAWTIAHRVYADFSEKRKQNISKVISENYSDEANSFQTNHIDKYIDTEDDAYKLNNILCQIGFLSKIYRDVMVMYYLDELKTADIADKLGITENAVKQRLFSARNTIRSCITSSEKEVSKMNNNKILKPYNLWMPGTGDLRYGDPRDQATRLLSKNILISCRNTEKSANELAEEFNVPTIFIEDELEILGGDLLKKCDNGKYITNFIIADKKVQDDLNTMLECAIQGLADEITEYIISKKKEILSIPFLYKPKSFEYILWSMIPRFADMLKGTVTTSVQNEMLKKGIEKENRHFHIIGVAITYGDNFKHPFYSQNGTSASNYMGYTEVSVMNYIGERLPWDWNRFGAAVNLDFNKELGMVIKASRGLKVGKLTEDEKEIAAKAINMGYIRKQGDIIEPNILIMDTKAERKWNKIFIEAQDITNKHAKEVLKSYNELVKNTIPKHLVEQSSVFVELTSNPIRHLLIEGCIRNGLIYIPTEEKCSEGIWATIK